METARPRRLAGSLVRQAGFEGLEVQVDLNTKPDDYRSVRSEHGLRMAGTMLLLAAHAAAARA